MSNHKNPKNDSGKSPSSSGQTDCDINSKCGLDKDSFREMDCGKIDQWQMEAVEGDRLWLPGCETKPGSAETGVKDDSKGHSRKNSDSSEKWGTN